MREETAIAFSIDKERDEYHYRKRRKKIIKLIICLIIWTIIIIYLITPFSTYKMMNVKGNVYLSEEEIIEMGEIKNLWWWIIDSDKLKHKLESYENIDNVSISRGFNGLNISIVEKYPIAIRDGKYFMNTSPRLIEKDKYPLKIEKLVDISEIGEEYLNLFSNQYIHLDLDVRESFYKAYMEEDKIIVLEGKFEENVYFRMKLNLDCLSIKLSREKFINIKSEILGKKLDSNVKYTLDNPCIVKYDFTNVYEYQIG